MEQLTVFSNEQFGQVRTIEEDGKVLFCANDVAKALGYSKPRNAVAQHCKGVLKRNGVSYTTNQHGKETAQITEMNFIPEGDVYRLIARSKLPAAEKFESWVFDEVLPSIRKIGGYGEATIIMQQLEATTNMLAGIAQAIATVARDLSKARYSTSENMVLDEEIPRRIKSHSIISHLDAELRQEVEQMICSRKFTYSDIVEHLDEVGVKISAASVHRYAKYIGVI
ncbi:MAG: BRO family protein [Oscillospiraceae bacterium]